MIDRRIGKIKVRRGTDSQRKVVTFEEGELVYSIDKKRLYVGNSKETGGILVSNRNYVKNSLGNPPVVPTEAQHGDIIHDKSNSKTYITKFNGSIYELILIADLSCGTGLQNQINDLNNKMNQLAGCLAPKPPPVVPPEPSKLSWYIQPSDNIILIGDTLTLTSSAAGGTGTVLYEWKRTDNTVLVNNTNNVLTISNAQNSDIATYYCVANNSTESITSRNAVITLKAPPVVPPEPSKLSWYDEPIDISVFVGDTFTLTSSAAGGSGNVSYEWKRTDNTTVASNTDRILTINNSLLSDFSTYYCVANNSTESITSRNATVSVKVVPPPPPPTTVLTWFTEPSDTTVNLGQKVIFNSLTTGTGTISYLWKRRDGNNINSTNINSADLTIDSSVISDIATYYCVASNTTESITSKNAVLDILANSILAEDGTYILSQLGEFIDWEESGLVVPTITTQPRSLLTTSLVPVTFEVTATGSEPLSYQWRINGENVAGETNRTYTVTNPTKDIIGITCRVSNVMGGVISNSVNLTVGIKPTITTHPVSQSVNVGSSVTFSVVAAGSNPLSYQWNKDGVVINGATSSTYTINSVSNSDFANYNCVVSNSYGNVVSNNANLKLFSDTLNISLTGCHINMVDYFNNNGWDGKESSLSGFTINISGNIGCCNETTPTFNWGTLNVENFITNIVYNDSNGIFIFNEVLPANLTLKAGNYYLQGTVKGTLSLEGGSLNAGEC